MAQNVDASLWHPQPGPQDSGLHHLEKAWRDWAREDGLPFRPRFDPMAFPKLLQWMMLGEIVDRPNDTRPYDVLGRYLGREIEHYFATANFTRRHLSEVGPVYAERWFGVIDQAIAARAPICFHGSPYRTGFDFIRLEMLTLPFARSQHEVGYILFAMAREAH
ncbi:hypothetical protein A8950_1444 [Dongia mobilis]|uniref:PAS domain-containing protein n=1 Tax=Dongia mobilis TaxID=578943 RepID=A0A4R6WTR8_9PROT|nr:hypothetical protein [Dongia mobilis]TDQ83159.1 hypothetical protein A8950_1444 [Dongia mobilis]